MVLGWCVLLLVAVWQISALVYDFMTFVPFVKPAKKKRGLGKERWSPDKLTDAPYDAVIVGSGMAGLSCAALLSTFGYRVLVLEQHETVGGGAHCYAVDGKSKWKFDSGLHYTIPQAALCLLAVALASRVPASRDPRQPCPC